MILLISINKISFHYYEFVKPVEDILRRNNICFQTTQYNDINQKILDKADKIIICGTSLKDNSFVEEITKFEWLKKFDKPVLGICGGMHLLGLVFNGELRKAQEIGLKTIKYKKEFFGFKDDIEVYELHNYYAKSEEFEVIAESEKCIQAVKHKHKPFYAVLFHPEVRNKKLIENFAKN